MLGPDRRRRVLAHIREHGSASVQALVDELGVSAWTVRRDLDQLEREGQVVRTHGGATAAHPGADAPTPPGSPGDDRAKTRIAAAAADLLPPDGATVMVLGGSSTQALVPHLAGRSLTVVTNSLEIANGLKHAHDVTLVMLGGYLHREQMTLLGPLSEASMADLHVELMIAGAYGVDPGRGVTGAKVIQAGYHHRMLDHAERLLLLADASKLGRRGPTLLARMEQVHTLVTDSRAPAGLLERLRDAGPEVVVAG